jgi:hypothetical protein
MLVRHDHTGCSIIPTIRSHTTKILVPTNYIAGIGILSRSEYCLEITHSRRFWRDLDDRHGQVCDDEIISTGVTRVRQKIPKIPSK